MKDSKFTGLVVAEGVNSNGTPWFLGSLESGDNVIIGRTEDEVSRRTGKIFRYQPSKGNKGQFEVLGYFVN